jgi:hypothetical protein
LRFIPTVLSIYFRRHLDLESADWLERCSWKRGVPSESSGDEKSKIGADIYSLK